MATSSTSAPSCLNHLIQQRREITAARDKEDSKRVAKDEAGDKIFEHVQIFKIARFEAAEALRLARERANQEAVLVQIKAHHESELAKLRSRQSKELKSHDKETKKMLAEIQEDTDVLIGELLWDLDAEARTRSLKRQKEEEEIQEKRKREDNFYKELVFRAIEDEARQPIRPSSTNLRAHPLVSNNKRAHSDHGSATPKKAQIASSNAIPRALRSSKRRKSDDPPQAAEVGASTSPSATLSPGEMTDLAGESSSLADDSGKNHTSRSIQTCFELKYISDNFHHDPTATTWKTVPGQPNRTLRANLKNKTFEPYDGDFCESSQQPTWVLNAVDAHVFCDCDSARMHMQGERGGMVLELEFADSGEFDAFMVLFKEYYEGLYLSCLPVRSPTDLPRASY
jgi:hypothetical protein